MNKPGCIYIMANKKYGTIYIGVTSNLKVRVFQHKNKTYTGFTEKYDCNILVYYESFDDIYAAIEREKQIKNWRRQWKINLFQVTNPDWDDLSYQL